MKQRLLAALTVLAATSPKFGKAEEATVLTGAQVYYRNLYGNSSPAENVISQTFFSYNHSRNDVAERYIRISMTQSKNVKTVFIAQEAQSSLYTCQNRLANSYICVSDDISSYPPADSSCTPVHESGFHPVDLPPGKFLTIYRPSSEPVTYFSISEVRVY